MRKNLGVFAIIGLLGLSGCVSTSVIPFSENTLQINTSADPVCGGAGAQKVALTDAAIATLNAGFDSFIIQGSQAQNNVRVVGYTPVEAHTTSNGDGTSYTTVSGGQPIVGGTHDHSIVVQMFHASDPNAANTISARGYLGPDWQKIAAKGFPQTCT
jgi:hypothetical protein